jgi:hypothetical protein
MAAPCSVCSAEGPKYVCPRCRAPYCAVACYKSHSKQCVAAFHGETLQGLLRGERVGDEQRRATEAILQREQEAAREEALELQEEEELGLALELAERDDFDPAMLPAHLRQQFEHDTFT